MNKYILAIVVLIVSSVTALACYDWFITKDSREQQAFIDATRNITLPSSPDIPPPTASSTPSATIAPSYTPIPTIAFHSSDITDQQFIQRTWELTDAVEGGNVERIIQFQRQESIPCKNVTWVEVCKGEEENAIARGYSIGGFGSEGNILLLQNYRMLLTQIFTDQGTFSYYSSSIQAKKGSVLFLSDKNKCIAFRFSKENEIWEMNGFILQFNEEQDGRMWCDSREY